MLLDFTISILVSFVVIINHQILLTVGRLLVILIGAASGAPKKADHESFSNSNTALRCPGNPLQYAPSQS